MWSWQSSIVGLTLVVSTISLPQYYHTNDNYERTKTAYIRNLEAEVERAARAGAAVEALQLEDALEDSILQQARDSVVQDSGDPARAARDLEELQEEWRRDKRAVGFLSGLLGSSSGGGGGHAGGDGGGSGSGSILNLVGPLLGSSSGGGGGGGDGGASAGGSDSGSILNLVGPLLGSSSGGSGGGGDSDGGSAGGSDSGSILNLVGPLLGSSSGGGGSGGGGGDAGSGSGSILNLLGPLLGSSSGSSGGSGGDGSGGGGSGGGGSDLSSILGISNSSGGGAGGGAGHSGGSDAGIGGAVNAVKVGFVQDKIQLLLRLKFGIFTKLLNSLSGALAAASSPQHVPIHELKYPDP